MTEKFDTIQLRGGNFYIGYTKLGSLDDIPEIIKGDFPEIVEGGFYCCGGNFTTLIGVPRIITGSLDCSHNPITTLDGFPDWVGGDFLCCGCPDLIKLEVCKIVDRVGGSIYYSDWLEWEDKDQLKKERDLAVILKHTDLGNIDI